MQQQQQKNTLQSYKLTDLQDLNDNYDENNINDRLKKFISNKNNHQSASDKNLDQGEIVEEKKQDIKADLFRKFNDQLQNKNKPACITYVKNPLTFLQKFPSLFQIKNKSKASHFQIQNLVTNYQTHHKLKEEQISLYFNPDGSQAIFFTKYSDQKILSKLFNTRESYEELFYNDAFEYLIVIGKKLSLEGVNFDQNQQEYEDNKIPLSTYISMKFEDQIKIFNQMGVASKPQLKKFKVISNVRLRNDLVELFECLNIYFEFENSFSSDHYFAYYTQSQDFNILEATIIGPQDTPYEGIPYTLTMKIPENYPNSPPQITFNQQILHPNISDEGKICLDILQDKWSSVLTLQKVLISIVSLLSDKNLDDVYNHYAKYLYKENPEELKKLIKQQAISSLCQNLEINYKELNRLPQYQPLQSNCVKEFKQNNQENDEDVQRRLQ